MPVHAAVRHQIQVATITQAVLRTLGFGTTPMDLRDDGHFDWAPEDGEKVRVRPKHRLPGMPDTVFAVKETVDVRPHAMHTLQAPDGRLWKWFGTDQLMPISQEDSMNAIDQAQKAKDTATAVKALRTDDVTVTTYMKQFNVGGINDHEPEQTVSLSVRPGENFDDLCGQLVRDRGISWREAVRVAQEIREDLARARP